MAYWEFKDSDYTKLRKDLLIKKGGALQKEFLEAARESKSFVKWMEECTKLEKNDGEEFNLFANSLTESEYKDLPIDREKELFDKWVELTPKQGSHETFWGYVTLKHIEKGVIESSYLAANVGNSTDGLGRIDEALKKNNHKSIDDTVRTVIRRL